MDARMRKVTTRQISNKIDLFVSLLFLITGMLFGSWSVVYEIGSTDAIGPGFFPTVISAVLITMGLVGLIKYLFWK
jgi:hypothetical protein